MGFKTLIFSDLHVAQHKKSVNRLHDCLKVLEWVYQTAEEHKVRDIIFGGDLFHDREKIDVLAYHLTFELIEAHSNKFNVYLLLGNHDLWYFDKWNISSLKPLSAIKNVIVVDKPSVHIINGYKVDFLPFTHNPLEHMEELKKNESEILVAHIAIDGAKLNATQISDVVVEHDGEMIKVSKDSFSHWKHVFLGHYHSPQQISDNIEYIGSPLQLDFGEAFQKKHLIIFDFKSKEKQYIENTISPKHLVIKDDDIDNHEIKNNFVKIQTSNVGTVDLVNLKNQLHSHGPGTLQIVPIAKKDSDHIVKDAKAILTNKDEMIENYLEQIETTLEKKVLSEIGKDICKEAKL